MDDTHLVGEGWRLGEVITPRELEALGLTRFLVGQASLFPVPIEAVVRFPGEALHPREGRVYGTGRYLLDGTIVAGVELRHPPELGEGGGRDEILLSEVWVDHGSDGHTSYEMRGWTLLPRSIFARDLNRLISEHRPPGQFPISVDWDSYWDHVWRVEGR